MYVQEIANTRVDARVYRLIEALETMGNPGRDPHFRVEVVADAGSTGAHEIHNTIVVQLVLGTRKEAEAVWRALTTVALDAVPAAQFPSR
jgi:hypothetical protein